MQHVINWRRLGSDKKTWPTQWWQSGWQFEAMTSTWFRFEEAFIYDFMCYFSFSENRRELMHVEWAGVSEYERRVCATVMKIEWDSMLTFDIAMIMWAWRWRESIFLASYRNFGALWDWKRWAWMWKRGAELIYKRVRTWVQVATAVLGQRRYCITWWFHII